MRRPTRRALLLLSAMLLAPALAAQPAVAGTEIVTGEDEHCASSGPTDDICIATRKVIEYARGGAPDPSRRLLVIECEGDVAFIQNAYTTDPPMTVVCPGTAAYDDAEFSVEEFSAIVVGRYEAESADLNPRAGDFEEFFDDGGGIATFDAEELPADTDNYDFLPLPVTLVGNSPSDPYTVTAEGAAATGLTNGDVNGYSPHNVYATPGADDPLRVGLRDTNGDPVLLFARLDRRAPDSSSPGCVSPTEIGVTVTDETNGSGPGSVRYTLDGGAEQTVDTDDAGTARIAVADGEHTVVFRGVDEAGNVEEGDNSVTATCTATPPPPPPPPPPAPQQPLADITKPRATLARVPRRCVRRRFRVRVRAQDAGGLASVRVSRDRRRLAIRRFAGTTAVAFSVRVPVRRLRAGRHRIVVVVRDAANNRTRRSRSFRVCSRRRR